MVPQPLRISEMHAVETAKVPSGKLGPDNALGRGGGETIPDTISAAAAATAASCSNFAVNRRKDNVLSGYMIKVLSKKAKRECVI